jgi:hypothetical protein
VLRLVSPGPLVNNVLRLIAADTLPNVAILNPQEVQEAKKPPPSGEPSAERPPERSAEQP